MLRDRLEQLCAHRAGCRCGRCEAAVQAKQPQQTAQSTHTVSTLAGARWLRRGRAPSAPRLRRTAAAFGDDGAQTMQKVAAHVNTRIPTRGGGPMKRRPT
jgi:hypothetical protein